MYYNYRRSLNTLEYWFTVRLKALSPLNGHIKIANEESSSYENNWLLACYFMSFWCHTLYPVRDCTQMTWYFVRWHTDKTKLRQYHSFTFIFHSAYNLYIYRLMLISGTKSISICRLLPLGQCGNWQEWWRVWSNTKLK